MHGMGLPERVEGIYVQVMEEARPRGAFRVKVEAGEWKGFQRLKLNEAN